MNDHGMYMCGNTAISVLSTKPYPGRKTISMVHDAERVHPNADICMLIDSETKLVYVCGAPTEAIMKTLKDARVSPLYSNNRVAVFNLNDPRRYNHGR